MSTTTTGHQPTSRAAVARAFRLLVDEARETGGQSTADPTAWRIDSANGWWSVFGSPEAYAKARTAGAPAHCDLVARDFTADEPNRLC